MRLRNVIALFFLFLTVNVAVAQVPDIPRLTQEITIDGDLSEAAWQQAASLELPYVTFPRENTPSPVKTIVRYFDNGDTLFVSFEAHDPEPDQIRAFFSDRDRIWRDDFVGIKLDPYNDHRLVFEFFVNPLGVQADTTVNVVQGNGSDAWDGIWESDGKITENGYQVEMAIPLRNFNFEPLPGQQTWAVEFLRFYPRNERLRISNIQIDRNNECWSCQMPEVRGLENIQQGKALEIVPVLVVGQSETRDLPDNLEWESESNFEPGLDIKWGISSDIFLNATINPDFSQVEADSAQLGINNNFTLFFPEQRPFFLENQDLFDTNLDLVYTRNIGAPDIGAKLTGKSGKHTYGIFAANDVNTTFLVPGNLSSSVAVIEEDSYNAALRYRYDANDDLSVGVLGTFRTSDDYHNYVGSVDLAYRITEQDELKAQIIHTDTEYPEFLSDEFCDGEDCENLVDECTINDCSVNEQVLRLNSDEAISDQAYRIRYTHEERDWYASAQYLRLGKDYRADLGFQRQTDITQAVVGGGLIFWGEEDDWYNRWRIQGDWDIKHNINGELIEKEWEIEINVSGPLQSYAELGCTSNQQVGNRLDPSNLSIDGNTELFKRNYCYVYGNVQPMSGLFIENEFLWGTQIDFRNNRLADRTTVRPGFEYAFNRHLRAELNYLYEKLETDGIEVFTANQADLRVNYNLDVRNSIRLSVIYTDIHQNLDNQPGVRPEDLPNEDFSQLSTQLIYSYQINPQTVFFAGYSDNAFKNDDQTSLEKDARSLFMKFSYAWLY